MPDYFLRDRNAEKAARASSDCNRSRKMHDFGIDLPIDGVKPAAHQRPRHRHRAGRKRRDLARRLQRRIVDGSGSRLRC